MSVESFEAQRQPSAELTIRGHHVKEIAKIVSGYESASNQALNPYGQVIPIEELYLYPNEGSLYIEQIVADITNDQLASYTDGLGGAVLYDDYLGVNGSKARTFQHQKTEFYKKILLSQPDTLIEINGEPDDICRACQSTPEGMPGNHCLARSKDDDRYVQLISQLYPVSDGQSGVTIPTGILRDPENARQILETRGQMSLTLEHLIKMLLDDQDPMS